MDLDEVVQAYGILLRTAAAARLNPAQIAAAGLLMARYAQTTGILTEEELKEFLLEGFEWSATWVSAKVPPN